MTLKLVVTASIPSVQHIEDGVRSGWFIVKKWCASGLTRLSAGLWHNKNGLSLLEKYKIGFFFHLSILLTLKCMKFLPQEGKTTSNQSMSSSNAEFMTRIGKKCVEFHINNKGINYIYNKHSTFSYLYYKLLVYILVRIWMYMYIMNLSPILVQKCLFYTQRAKLRWCQNNVFSMASFWSCNKFEKVKLF